MGQPKEKDVPITMFQQMISSCSGAFMTSFLVTPLDVVKIRLQAQQKPFHKGTTFIYHNGLMDHLCVCSHCVANGNGSNNLALKNRGSSHLHVLACKPGTCQREWYYRSQAHFEGTLDAMLKISRTEGLTSLWSGLSPTLVMAVPATVIYFTVYDHLKYAWGYNEKDPSSKYVPVIAGMAARTFTTTLISPVELIRTKMQSEQLNYSDIGKAVRITVNQCGAVILLRGLEPTLLRDVPFSGIYWYGYEYLKALQMRRSGNIDGPPTFTQSFLAGATAGTVAGLITLPFDVIKTHRQIELGNIDFCKDKKITSTWSLIKKVNAEKGLRGLFAGITPRLAKITPACAIMISTYEYGKSFFRNYNQQAMMGNT